MVKQLKEDKKQLRNKTFIEKEDKTERELDIIIKKPKQTNNIGNQNSHKT